MPKKPLFRRKEKENAAASLPSTQKEREAREADRLMRAEERHDPSSKLNIAMPYIWIAVAIFLGFCLYTDGGGIFGNLIRFLFLSFFSYAAYLFPAVFFLLGLRWRRSVAERSRLRRTLLFLLALTLILALIYIVTLPRDVLSGTTPKEEVPLGAADYFSFSSPSAVRGGFIGALSGWVLFRLVGPVLTLVLAALAVLLYGIFSFGFSPDGICRSAVQHLRERFSAAREKKKESADTHDRRGGVPIGEMPTDTDTEIAHATVNEAPPQTENERHQRFATLFGEDTPAAAEEAAPPTVTDHAAFKEQKIRERLRSHDGVHTYAVSDLRPTTISEPQDTPRPTEHAAGSITHMSAEVLTRVDKEEEAFRGVEDFRRITISEPARVHTVPFAVNDTVPPAAPTAAATAMPTAPRAVDEPPRVQSTPAATFTVRETPATSSIPLINETVEAAAVVRENGAEVDRAEPTAKPMPPAAPQAKRTAIVAGATYQYPPLSLLLVPPLNEDADQEEIQKNADTLVKTFESFGIPITITGYTRGPRITRYEFVQKAGIRVHKVASYTDDITQKLSTQGVRIEAPIPNKSSIGVEVPNRRSIPVHIRSLLDTETFRNADSRTTVAIGCDVTGTPVFFDISKAPHMLIAGATGMGKSVCINSLLISLLYKASPAEVRLILIDPKKVEFNVYSKIPHLLIPVINDPNKAAGALNWAVNEMEKRYDLIEAASVRDIKSYNAYCVENGLEPLPKIVIVIDELNDLMMTARKIVEGSICRIAQKARAAGIHLIIGTQRPSVNVITGDIKVNIPARIAFRVGQQVDSRTILDMTGAEKLLPQGDMLFSPTGTPQRVQGAFVKDEEVKAVTTFLSEAMGEAIFDDAILADIEKEAAKCASRNGDEEDEEDGGVVDSVMDDPKFEQALDIAFSTGSISTSLLQRTIGVGFGRGARFIDAMYKMGIVGEAKGGSRPRELLMNRAEYEEKRHRFED